MIGLKGAGEARLSPALRSRLKRRSERQASRKYDPKIAALRAQRSAIDRMLNREVRAIEQTVDAVQGDLSSSLGALKDTGLKGRFLKQAQNELVARQGDLAQSIPYLSAEARDAARADKMDLRTNIIDARIAKTQDAASTFDSLMGEARTDAEGVLKQRRERQREGGEERDEGLRNAMIAAREALSQWQANPEVEGPDGETARLQELNPLQTAEDWRRFAIGLTSQYEGVSIADAAKVLNQLRRRRPTTTAEAVRTGVGGVLRGIGG